MSQDLDQKTLRARRSLFPATGFGRCVDRCPREGAQRSALARIAAHRSDIQPSASDGIDPVRAQRAGHSTSDGARRLRSALFSSHTREAFGCCVGCFIFSRKFCGSLDSATKCRLRCSASFDEVLGFTPVKFEWRGPVAATSPLGAADLN